MRLIRSKQRNVPFVFCASPVTIDKSADWGPGNLQNAPNGAFLKMSSPTEVSHLVQPNEDKTAPIGWVPGDGSGLFNKAPIWVEEEILQPGTSRDVNTLDGMIVYQVREPSMICYNGDEKVANIYDGWIQTVRELTKNYEL